MMNLKKASKALAVFYALAVGGLMLYEMDHTPREFIALVFTALLPFWIWNEGPQFLLLLYVAKFRMHWMKIASLVLQVLGFAWSALVFYDGFFVHPDAQNGLLYVFVPLWQYVLILLIGAVFKVTEIVLVRKRG